MMAKTTRQRPKAVRAKKKTVRKPPKPKRRGRGSSPKKSTAGFFGMPPVALVCYGPPGVGKTDWASRFPDPGFIIDPQEEGIRELVQFRRCPEPVFIEEADNWERTLDLCNDIAGGSYDIKTAVFDSLTGFEKLCFHHHCDEHFEGDWSSKGFYSYQQGPKNAAKTDIPEWLDALNAIRKAGINVVVIAHSQVKPYNNPEGPDFDRYSTVCDKETWQQIHRWSKCVLFYNYHIDLDRKGPRTKANMENEARFIYTVWSPAYDAKNQWGLEPLIEGGESGEEAFSNFAEAFRKASSN